MKKTKKSLLQSNKMLVVLLILGLSLILYPIISNLWNQEHSAKAINSYVDCIESMDNEEFDKMWQEAISYNEELKGRKNPYNLPPELQIKYKEMLSVDNDGMIGYIDINKLNVELPIYHGVADDTLRHSVGHLEWSFLPTGGKGTHCVLSGHRGLPTAKLFTDIDELREGDTFNLNVLDRVLTYKVDQIRTVLPDDMAELLADPDQDYCTLVTCTPYGINTHRLLVRGVRTRTMRNDAIVVSEAVAINPLIVAVAIAVPILIIMFIVVMTRKPRNGKE